MLIRSVQPGSLRAAESTDGRKTIELRIITYGTVDSYGSVWMPGCLAEGLHTRLPQLAWGHSWSDVIGRALEPGTDDGVGPVVPFYLDDFDAVPRARQAHAQVQSGTIDDCSVGFGWDYEWHKPSEEELRAYPGATEIITKAELNEVSLVMRGAVPGAKVLTVRSQPGLVIDAQAAGDIMAQLQGGQITLKEALQAVEDSSITDPEAKPEDVPDGDSKGDEDPEGATEGGEPALGDKPDDVVVAETDVVDIEAELADLDDLLAEAGDRL